MIAAWLDRLAARMRQSHSRYGVWPERIEDLAYRLHGGRRKPDWYAPEPWPDRVLEWFFRRIWCPTFGHKWGQKMYDEVCWRCSISRPRMDVNERLYLIAKEVTEEVLGPGTWHDPRVPRRFTVIHPNEDRGGPQ